MPISDPTGAIRKRLTDMLAEKLHWAQSRATRANIFQVPMDPRYDGRSGFGVNLLNNNLPPELQGNTIRHEDVHHLLDSSDLSNIIGAVPRSTLDSVKNALVKSGAYGVFGYLPDRNAASEMAAYGLVDKEIGFPEEERVRTMNTILNAVSPAKRNILLRLAGGRVERGTK